MEPEIPPHSDNEIPLHSSDAVNPQGGSPPENEPTAATETAPNDEGPTAPEAGLDSQQKLNDGEPVSELMATPADAGKAAKEVAPEAKGGVEETTSDDEAKAVEPEPSAQSMGLKGATDPSTQTNDAVQDSETIRLVRHLLRSPASSTSDSESEADSDHEDVGDDTPLGSDSKAEGGDSPLKRLEVALTNHKDEVVRIPVAT